MSANARFAVLYRWRLHEGAEEAFVAAWSRISERLLAERGSLGSRLHRGRVMLRKQLDAFTSGLELHKAA